MIRNMRFMYACLCLAAIAKSVSSRARNVIVFPDDESERAVEPVITPPVLPILEHLERDPSTLLPRESRTRDVRPRFGFPFLEHLERDPSTLISSETRATRPRYGFGGGFNVAPSNGGLTASISSSASGPGASQSASQSFSFGFNEGFSASHSASQSASFNGFGSSHSGSQASSQAASFSGGSSSVSGASSQASSFGGSSSQSSSSSFGFNNGFDSLGFQPSEANFGEGLLDVRHRGAPNFPFPKYPKMYTSGSLRSSQTRLPGRNNKRIITTLVVTE